MQQDELKKFLTDFAGERLALLQRHEAARPRRQPLRFQQHLSVRHRPRRDASVLAGERARRARRRRFRRPTLPLPVTGRAERARRARSPRIGTSSPDDAKFLGAFVARWRDRVATVTHARHRTMLGVVLGESLEHQRLFEQAAAGFEDVLGRRSGGVARVGAVLPGSLARIGVTRGCCRAGQQSRRSRKPSARGARRARVRSSIICASPPSTTPRRSASGHSPRF